MLMTYIRELGKKGSFGHVLLRMNRLMAHFYLDISGKVAVEVDHCASKSDLERQHSSFKLEYPEDVVLLVELGEDEIDPHLVSSVLFSTSARDAYNSHKTLFKSNNGKAMLVNPLAGLEMEMAARVLYRINPSTCNILNPGDSIGEEAVVTEVKRRVGLVGGIPRHVFATPETFNTYKLSVFGANMTKIFVDILKLDLLHIPYYAKFYVSPFTRSGVKIPQYGFTYEEAAPSLFREMPESNLRGGDFFEFKFLSDNIALAVGTRIKNPQEIEMLKLYCLKSQLAEAIIRIGGMMANTRDTVIPEYRRDSWLWYEDVGYKGELTEANILINLTFLKSRGVRGKCGW